MIKAALKYVLPAGLRFKLRQTQKLVLYFWRRQILKWPIARGSPIKIIVGAAMTSQKGWYSTNEQWLDITKESDWKRIFGQKALLTHVLAEHVFEHLDENEMIRSLCLINQYMVVGGRIRIAVPDGYHPDPAYIRHVGVAGVGADAEDHKQLINCDSLIRALETSGFTPKLLEGYLSNGELVLNDLDDASGVVVRSRSNKETMAGKSGWAFPDASTSLIVDGVKEA